MIVLSFFFFFALTNNFSKPADKAPRCAEKEMREQLIWETKCPHSSSVLHRGTVGTEKRSVNKSTIRTLYCTTFIPQSLSHAHIQARKGCGHDKGEKKNKLIPQTVFSCDYLLRLSRSV